MFLMKIAFVGCASKDDKSIFFDMLRTNMEHGLWSEYQTTIGVNICVKHFYEENDQTQIAKIIMWDISPTGYFKWVRPLFYNGSIGAIVLHSDNSSEGTQNTIAILQEFQKQTDIPKYLLVLVNPNEKDEKVSDNLIKLEKYAKKSDFIVKYFELDESYFEKPQTQGIFNSFWKKLRKFYEITVLDIFCDAVRNIPGNSYDIEAFRKSYFNILDEYDKTLRKMYSLLDEIGLEHDDREIYVKLGENLFTINIFSSACYYHFKDSTDTKFFCIVSKNKNFLGWSNIIFLPKNFLLSISKALYLLNGEYDSITKKQLRELKKK